MLAFSAGSRFETVDVENGNYRNIQTWTPRSNEMPEAEEEKIMGIDDARIPEAIRAHAQRFRTPVSFVIDLGDGEYMLSAKDGELVDLVLYPSP